MKGILIPKDFAHRDDLIVIPRKEYEELLSQQNDTQKLPVKFKTFVPTAAQKRDLKRAREEISRGEYMSFDELKRKLAVKG